MPAALNGPLQRLVLQACRIANFGAAALAAGLRDNSTLRELRIIGGDVKSQRASGVPRQRRLHVRCQISGCLWEGSRNPSTPQRRVLFGEFL